MNNIADIPLKDLVFVGGGHSHVHVLKMMGMSPIPGVRVTLITKDIESPYSGMVPGYVAGYYSREQCHIDVGRLCSWSKVRLFHTEVTRIDTAEKLIFCADGRPPVSYDVLSINIGIVPRPLGASYGSQLAKNLSDIITPVKPIDKFAARWENMLDRVVNAGLSGSSSRVVGDERFTIAIVGGGGGGVELAFAVRARLKKQLTKMGKNPDIVRVILLNRGASILSTHPKSVQNIIKRLLVEKGIEVFNDADVCGLEGIDSEGGSVGTEAGTDMGKHVLLTKDCRKFAFDEAFWCTQAVAQSWTKLTGLECNEDGFICVKATLESTNVRGVFACGDVCHLVESPRPKAGVFAVRAGPPLYRNLCQFLRGFPDSLERWIPQDTFLGIFGTGDGYAVASKGGVGLEGEFLWKLKDRIDVVWMAQYQVLPSMEEMLQEKAAKKLRNRSSSKANGQSIAEQSIAEQEGGEAGSQSQQIPEIAHSMGQETIDMLSKAQMRCGGCGSKVGAQVLSRALARVQTQLIQSSRQEVISGVGGRSGDDAALVRAPAAPAYLVQSMDYFRSFISDPFVMGEIAANHALSDVYAMNGDPISALSLNVLPYGPEDKVEEMLAQMLAGALRTFSAAGCALVGGHTSEGAEAALGFSVTGTVLPERALHKGPLPLGHSLILTKPIGTGTIMAADMRAQARGGWVVSAIDSMRQSNQRAAQLLGEFGCSACTDVTGFGLLGHLLEMIQYEQAEHMEDDRKVSVVSAGEEDSGDGGGDGAGKDRSSGFMKTAVRLDLAAVPLLPGAAVCVEKGILSSLHPQNIRCSRAVDNPAFGDGVPAYPLLFDPQTSGGLLATVPAERAEILVEALRTAGYDSAAVIGTVVAREQGPFPPLVFLQ